MADDLFNGAPPRLRRTEPVAERVGRIVLNFVIIVGWSLLALATIAVAYVVVRALIAFVMFASRALGGLS